jgi:L-aminopeptidase/D-esterase-like protein
MSPAGTAAAAGVLVWAEVGDEVRVAVGMAGAGVGVSVSGTEAGVAEASTIVAATSDVAVAPVVEPVWTTGAALQAVANSNPNKRKNFAGLYIKKTPDSFVMDHSIKNMIMTVIILFRS